MNSAKWIRDYIFQIVLYGPGKLRALPLRIFAKSIGRDVRIENNCTFINPKNISIGNHVFINRNVEIDANCGTVDIGNNVLIGSFTSLHTANHKFEKTDIPIIKQGLETNTRIVVEDDVWIGGRVYLLPNITIGTGSVVAAGAVVTKDVPPYTIVGGVPAKVIGKRK